MSYDYYRNANFLSDSDATARKAKETLTDEQSDELLSGDYGGRGTGLAGGYPAGGPRFPRPESDDAAYDPGMAGCASESSPCAIAGMPRWGAEHLPVQRPGDHPGPCPYPSLAPRTRNGPVKVWISHGYERDGDEYDTSLSSSPASSIAPQTPTGETSVSGAGPSPSQSQSQSQNKRADPNTGSGTSGPHTKPPIGTRIVGRVERLAGKVFRDPEIEARGTRHVTGRV